MSEMKRYRVSYILFPQHMNVWRKTELEAQLAAEEMLREMGLRHAEMWVVEVPDSEYEPLFQGGGR